MKSALLAREVGAKLMPLPQVHDGTLVLGDNVVIGALPIKPLDAYRGTSLHYLDISGVRASCLADFGGDDETLAAVAKLYAGRCLLTNLRGLERFTSLRYLYLDHNLLESLEWTSLNGDGAMQTHSLSAASDESDSATGWEPRQLLVIDLQGNPITQVAGWDAPLDGLPQLEWLNGTRWTAARRAATRTASAEEPPRLLRLPPELLGRIVWILCDDADAFVHLSRVDCAAGRLHHALDEANAWRIALEHSIARGAWRELALQCCVVWHARIKRDELTLGALGALGTAANQPWRASAAQQEAVQGFFRLSCELLPRPRFVAAIKPLSRLQCKQQLVGLALARLADRAGLRELPRFLLDSLDVPVHSEYSLCTLAVCETAVVEKETMEMIATRDYHWWTFNSFYEHKTCQSGIDARYRFIPAWRGRRRGYADSGCRQVAFPLSVTEVGQINAALLALNAGALRMQGASDDRRDARTRDVTILLYNDHDRAPIRELTFGVDACCPWSFTAAMRRILACHLHAEYEKSLIAGEWMPSDVPHESGRFANIEMPTEVQVE